MLWRSFHTLENPLLGRVDVIRLHRMTGCQLINCAWCTACIGKLSTARSCGCLPGAGCRRFLSRCWRSLVRWFAPTSVYSYDCNYRSCHCYALMLVADVSNSSCTPSLCLIGKDSPQKMHLKGLVSVVSGYVWKSYEGCVSSLKASCRLALNSLADSCLRSYFADLFDVHSIGAFSIS